MTELQSIVNPEVNNLIDRVEDEMINGMVASGEFEVFEPPLRHIFTPNLYAREITMKPGLRITSKIHLTEHQFIISQGKAIVFQNGKQVILEAPYHGITNAGTRRVLLIPEDSEVDCIWTTFHFINDGETIEDIENRIIEKHDNPLLGNNNSVNKLN